jgi:phospholipid transport system substrate-binding protein
MTTIRTRMRRAIPAVAVAIFFFGGAAKADDSQDAAKFIDDFGNRAIKELTEPSLSEDDLHKRFRVLFEEGFDVPYLAKAALGRFWPRASEQERTDYVAAFEDYMVQVYSQKFRSYSGQTFKATASRPGPEGMTGVSSEVTQPEGPTTLIEWTVANVSGKQKIRDIKIEGVSMITTYRDEFANLVLQHDGKVAGLIDALRTKVLEPASADKG